MIKPPSQHQSTTQNPPPQTATASSSSADKRTNFDLYADLKNLQSLLFRTGEVDREIVDTIKLFSTHLDALADRSRKRPPESDEPEWAHKKVQLSESRKRFNAKFKFEKN